MGAECEEEPEVERGREKLMILAATLAIQAFRMASNGALVASCDSTKQNVDWVHARTGECMAG